MTEPSLLTAGMNCSPPVFSFKAFLPAEMAGPDGLCAPGPRLIYAQCACDYEVVSISTFIAPPHTHKLSLV